MQALVRRTLVAMGVVVLSASTLAAQGAATATKPISFGISAGATMPMGDFGDAAATGFNVGGLLEAKPAAMPVAFRFEVDYNRHSFSDDLSALADGNFNVISGTANVAYKFPTTTSPVRPYILGGVGMYRMGVEIEDESDSETKMGLNGGAGIEIPLSGFTSFIELRYHTVFTDDSNTNYMPIKFGIRF